MYRRYFKFLFDFIISFLCLVITIPVILLITLILCLINDCSPFFIQSRPGKSGKNFNLIKFKTMTDKKDEMGRLLPDRLRLTKFGGFIRSTSLDELPQLINVLKGDMSLVGPRPLLVKYLPLYNELQSRRHEVKPGITGWTQVNGRNSLSWEKKFELDVWYVDNVSFVLDLKILIKTLRKVFLRDGISSEGVATMPPFLGSKQTYSN